MKTFRPVIGIILVAGALWVIVGEQMSGVSADAVVNAPVVTVRSSTAGKLSMPKRPLGAHVDKGERLATVDDILSDTTRLEDLRMELANAEANVARIKSDLAAKRTQRDAYSARTKLYRTHRIAEIETKLKFARARLDRLQPNAQSSETSATKVAQTATAEAGPVTQAREDVALLENALDAAKSGVYLGDGYNDAPSSEQRGALLDEEIASLEADLTEAEARVKTLDARRSKEQTRVNTLTSSQVTSPANGIYWETLQADGVTVQRGDPIMSLVDCDVSLVTASVSEGVYNTLKVGDSATFKLAARDKIYDATIARLAGSGAARVYQHLAIAPSQKHLERYDMTLLVPDLKSDADLDCPVGRTGRVFFEHRPLDFLR
ncbi:HlyD family secretion protein [Thioclava electrotropha]|uniref:HlyD family efflux transporter periplasmic adaptor subunit n=1 Tax=Thioclava electrotropha TaxID=1549850 RepID=A0ABX6YSU6_9RHOB|nr:HlyD family efflux transporter periplasmic adaptor subunit [Thioclava electrotropha]QPZ90927.1 HlyD family efflux transporter periplasmic adaptor subunit [Thioclava electrotropha]